MVEYLRYGMSGFALLMMLIGVWQICGHRDDETPLISSADPGSRSLIIAEHNVRMLRAVGDQMIGAALISGGFVGGCVLWF